MGVWNDWPDVSGRRADKFDTNSAIKLLPSAIGGDGSRLTVLRQRETGAVADGKSLRASRWAQCGCGARSVVIKSSDFEFKRIKRSFGVIPAHPTVDEPRQNLGYVDR